MGSPRLLVGPLLRFVDATRASLWVETDRGCRVRVDAGEVSASEATWSVHGHHYAIVVLDGLAPGSVTEYTVALDDVAVWPEASPQSAPTPGTGFPPSVIRTHDHDEVVRICFGSCRQSAPLDEAGVRQFGADALVALAERTAAAPHHERPDLLFLGGDQVYADEPSQALRDRLATRPRPHPDLAEEIADFEEYTWLYHESWMEPAVRWLFSTVPTVMMLDDHDLRDDWNTSVAWREEVSSKPWWRERVTGALGSYWIYQHLGNLAPEDLEADPIHRLMRTEPDHDVRTKRLDEFAFRADAEPPSARWSVVRDLDAATGAVRLVVLDSRCSRQLDPEHRAIVDDVEWAWFRDRVLERPVDHLLIGSTLPVLLPPGIHHLEGWDEAVAGGAWGRRAVRIAERLRQALDLEHWASFRASMHRLCDLLVELAGPGSTQPPASVLMLSGDVHSSYVAGARLPGVDPGRTTLAQLTMSPFRNPLHRPIRLANTVLTWLPARRLARLVARRAGVQDVPLEWELDQGIWFDNGVMTVVIEGRQVAVEVDHAVVEQGRHVLRRTYRGTLGAFSRPA